MGYKEQGLWKFLLDVVPQLSLLDAEVCICLPFWEYTLTSVNTRVPLSWKAPDLPEMRNERIDVCQFSLQYAVPCNALVMASKDPIAHPSVSKLTSEGLCLCACVTWMSYHSLLFDTFPGRQDWEGTVANGSAVHVAGLCVLWGLFPPWIFAGIYWLSHPTGEAHHRSSVTSHGQLQVLLPGQVLLHTATGKSPGIRTL